MLTCTYIFFVDEFNTHISRKTMLTLEKIKQPLRNPTKPSEFEEALRALINHSKKYILLFYHAVLTFLLTFDKKDFLTLLLLSLEAVIIPLHLHYYLKANTAKSFIGPMYRLYLPIFAAAIFFVVFRYVLFFQKYAPLTAGSPSSTTSTSGSTAASAKSSSSTSGTTKSRTTDRTTRSSASSSSSSASC